MRTQERWEVAELISFLIERLRLLKLKLAATMKKSYSLLAQRNSVHTAATHLLGRNYTGTRSRLSEHTGEVLVTGRSWDLGQSISDCKSR